MHRLLHDEKDIDSIFFYAINGNINYLTLFYTANNVKYKTDYKDVNFKETVDRIIKVYNTLKDEKNINLVGDLTKDIIEGKIKLNTNTYNNTIINTNNFDYQTMFPYISLIIKHTTKALGVETEDYIKNDYIFIPITFYKTNYGYKLKYKINKDKEYMFNSDINIFNKSIIINIKNKEYNGEIILDKLNINNSIVFKDNKIDKVIYSSYYENELSNKDIETIKKIFEMINIDYEINGIKTLEDNYLLYNKKGNYEYYMHLNIRDNTIRINLKQFKKYKKDNIDFKVEEEHFDYLIAKYNDKYILIQQKYLLSNNSSYEYKKNINKSRYYLLKANNTLSRLKDVKIEEHIVINDKIDCLEDIKKLTLQKDDVNGK